jgi:hypothetical protein
MQVRRRDKRDADPFEFQPNDRIGKCLDALQKHIAGVNDRQKDEQAGKRARDRIAKIVGEQIQEKRKRDDDDRRRKDDIGKR